MKIIDLREGDICIVKSYGSLKKIEIIEITETSILYENLDNNNRSRIRVDIGEFDYNYKILEIIDIENNDESFELFDDLEREFYNELFVELMNTLTNPENTETKYFSNATYPSLIIKFEYE